MARRRRALRLCVSGGAALPVEVLRGFEQAFGCVVLEGYGLSETSPVASFNHPDRERKPGSIGTPIAGVEMRLVDDGRRRGADGRGRRDRHPRPQRHEGLLAAARRRPPAAIRDGWFHTGDLASRDEDGYYFIVDRKKDMIIRGGYNVYPREIEEVLYEHPAVAEAAVVGMPAPTLGEEVGAAVALQAGCHRHARGAARVRQGAGRGLQVPAARLAGRRPAQGPDRQDPQARDRCLPTRAGGAVMTAASRPPTPRRSLDMLLAEAALGTAAAAAARRVAP